jgi:hypothetical protein
MRVGERAAVFLFKPIYRGFIKKPLWWFLARVKAFFFAELCVQLSNIERRLQALEQAGAQANASHTAQWDAMEQLLLSLFRDPESRTLDPDWIAGSPHESHILSASDLRRVDAADNIR